jgi:hypothetical protein
MVPAMPPMVCGVGGEVGEVEPGVVAPAEPPVGDADQWVEVGAGNRADEQDDDGEGGGGGSRVLEQLQAAVGR